MTASDSLTSGRPPAAGCDDVGGGEGCLQLGDDDDHLTWLPPLIKATGGAPSSGSFTWLRSPLGEEEPLALRPTCLYIGRG